jgi:hypothetical protein
MRSQVLGVVLSLGATLLCGQQSPNAQPKPQANEHAAKSMSVEVKVVNVLATVRDKPSFPRRKP